MQAINLSNAVSSNYFNMVKIRLSETVKEQTSETESYKIQSMYKVRAFDNGTDVLELSQPEEATEEASSDNAKEINNIMEKFKLKIMGTDEDGDKFKLMLNYSYKEVGANKLIQSKLRIIQQGKLEIPSDDAPEETPVEPELPNVDLVA